MENVIENNKLIALFMGYPQYKIDFKGKLLNFENSKHNIYHKDWNMLMPVVEKIAQSGNFCLNEYQSKTYSGRWYAYHISISNNTLSEVDKPFIKISSNYEEGESKISTYSRFCIEFINWYNQNKGI